MGIEPTYKSFADSCLTTWLPGQKFIRARPCLSGVAFFKFFESTPRSYLNALTHLPARQSFIKRLQRRWGYAAMT